MGIIDSNSRSKSSARGLSKDMSSIGEKSNQLSQRVFEQSAEYLTQWQ